MQTELLEHLVGVSSVLVAPFCSKTNELDFETTKILARRCVDAGIQTVTALGNTAELNQLSPKEQADHLKAVAHGAKGAATLAGVPGRRTDAFRIIDEATELGFSGLMLHEPMDPFTTESGLIDFWRGLAASTKLPVVPYVRMFNLSKTAFQEVLEIPSVVAVKLALPVEKAIAAINDHGVDATLWIAGGAESQFVKLRKWGVRSFTSGIANIDPTLPMRIWLASEADDNVAIDELGGLFAEFEQIRTTQLGRWNVSALKVALNQVGMNVGNVRPPYEKLDTKQQEKVKKIVSMWNA